MLVADDRAARSASIATSAGGMFMSPHQATDWLGPAQRPRLAVLP
jgi:hypothetical protein